VCGDCAADELRDFGDVIRRDVDPVCDADRSASGASVSGARAAHRHGR
jgi:hypothetical protein